MTNDERFHAMELGMQGYNCSQILLRMTLDALKKENPDLIRAVTGLLGGLGNGKLCGALTGGCCVLGLFAGKGTAEEETDERLQAMLIEFVEWFESEMTTRFDGIDCDIILAGDNRNRLSRCPSIVLDSYDKLKEILTENGYALDPA